MTMLKKVAMIATASSLAMMLGGCGDEASQKTYLPVPFESVHESVAESLPSLRHGHCSLRRSEG